MEIMDLIRTFHISPLIEDTFDDLSELYAAVLSQIGAAIVPQSLASIVSGSKAETLPIADADTGITYVMAWAKNISNPAAGLFAETVKKYAVGDDGGYGL